MGTPASPPHLLAGTLGGLARLISGARVRWVSCRPDTRQRIYFANHTSHLDFVVLWASLPPEVRVLARPVAARDYWIQNRLRRFLAEDIFRAVLINRAPDAQRDGFRAAEAVIDQMAAAMGDRDSLIVFPEGTRGSGEETAAFKGGLFHLWQRKPDAQLVPVYIENLNRILPKGEVLPVPLLSSVTFGAPLASAEDEPKRAFLERARAALCALKEAEE
jgi:1-acyl-sn-glycerol-3-phosphate acyltransferase